MTAREYLKEQLKDEWAEPTSVQTRKGLAAYAIRLHNKVPGYSIADAEIVIRSCGCSDEFIQKCTDYISRGNDFLSMVSLIRVYIED